MGIALFILIASLVVCPLVTVVKGFVLLSKEHHEEKIQKVSHMLRSVLVARHTTEVREAAMFYGIDSNEADIDAADLLEHREVLVKYLGEKQYKNIKKHIQYSCRQCYFPSYNIIVEKRHSINHTLDIAELVYEPVCRVFHLVTRGGDIDGEPASRNL